MTTVTCDICNKVTEGYIKISFKDGEHPHNESTCWTRKDVCMSCLIEIKHLICEEEYDEVVTAALAKTHVNT